MVSPTSESPQMVSGRGMAGDVIAPDVQTNIAIATPKDSVRWGPIFAGLFTALTTLVLLSTLGAAIFSEAFDPGDPAKSFGLGGGMWAGLSFLVAFFVGGLISARTAAVRGTGNGMFQGAMVCLVAVPLLMYLLISGAVAAARSAGSVVSTAAQTAAQGAAAASNTPQGQQAANEAQSKLPSADEAQKKIEQTGQQIQNAARDPQNQEKVADATAKTAWGTLVSLVLGLGAAMVGGLVGARSMDRHHHGRDLGMHRTGDHQTTTT